MTDIREKNQNGVTVFALSGRIDSEGAVDMDLALHTALSEGKYKMVLDMTDLSYINSAGLRTLADVLTQSQENGGDVKLAALSPKVQRVFEIVGFDNFFHIFETADEALGSF
jgi:anti-sigma B factor antagonist